MPIYCCSRMAGLPAHPRQLARNQPGWLLAGLLGLASCNGGPSLPTTRTPALAAGEQAGSASALRPQNASAIAQTVAPGLVVRIASAVPTDTAIGQDPEQQLVLTLERNGQIIFRDTTTDGLAYSAPSELQIAHLYPLWVPAGPDAGELLLAYSNRPNRDQARRFRIQGQRITRIDTLTTFEGPATNLDQDAWLEYAGYADYGEEWDDAQGHHLTYNPLLCYEVRPTGLVLDTALTIRRNRARYGKFYGYRYSEKPMITVKQPGR